MKSKVQYYQMRKNSHTLNYMKTCKTTFVWHLRHIIKKSKKVKSDITENDIKLNMHIRKAEHVWECLISVVTPIHET